MVPLGALISSHALVEGNSGLSDPFLQSLSVNLNKESRFLVDHHPRGYPISKTEAHWTV